jgi:signal transduction histidine kinase
VIASSPTDLQPVLDAVARNAAGVCGADDAHIRLLDGEALRLVATHGALPGQGVGETLPLGRGTVVGRAVIERKTLHIGDLSEEPGEEFPETRLFVEQRLGVRLRTMLATPLLREGEPIGAVVIRRLEVRPFTEQQITLLETFADQAVIAIENVRLFQELEARTRELARSVEELRALGEVGQAVSSTLDLLTVLTTIVAHAVQLSGADAGTIYEFDDSSQQFRLRAAHGMTDEHVAAIRQMAIGLDDPVIGRAAAAREAVQVPDIHEVPVFAMRQVLERAGFRALLALPLLQDERIVGALVVRRRAAGRFEQATVELLQTFAAQSVLAIQNARLFREIEEKSRQLEVVSRHKSEFLANMSHELRTPLNAIIGFSEVLAERMFGEVNEKQEEYLQDILASGRHLLSLINDILDLSKVEAGRMELEVGTFSLREALENGLTMLKERAGRHGIALGLEIDPDLDLIEADERKVKQVVFNLLSNAVKFTPDGGRVEVAARQVDGEVQIAVSDTGVGITPEDQAHIFEEFRQVGQGTAKAEGTGLGLALTKKFIEFHGGRIWVESRVGVGSTFTFALPLRPPAASDDVTAPQPAASGNV